MEGYWLLAILVGLVALFFAIAISNDWSDSQKHKALVAGPRVNLWEGQWDVAYECLNPECPAVMFYDSEPTLCYKCGGTDYRKVVARRVRCIGNGKDEYDAADIKGPYVPPPKRPVEPEGRVCGYCGRVSDLAASECKKCGAVLP